MANNFSNVMDGSRLTDQNIYTCRFCLKQFMYYSEYVLHERMHFEQVSFPGSLQGGLRPAYDNHVVPPYSSASAAPAPLDSFDKLIQPFRSTIPETDIRSQTDTRGLVQSSQPDLRNFVPSSPADHRNMAVSSPADPRNMVVSSPVDPRTMIPSSPADTRNMVPSSPADPRNIVPASPVDPRNLVPASPVDPRNMVPASPVDPRNMVPASPVDPRNMVPASPVDPRNMVPVSPVDPRNMVPASPVDPRNMVPASPVDPRNMVPASPVDPRNLMVSSPASLPDKSTQQLYRSEIEAQNMNHGSRSTPINIQSPSVSIPLSTDVRLLPIDTRPLQSQLTDNRHLSADSHSLTYSTSSFLDSLTRSLYAPDLTNKPMSTPPYGGHSMGRPEDILGLDNRQVPIQKPDPYYGIPKSIYHQPGPEVGDNFMSNQYGLGKLLSPQQGTYFQQNMSSQSQPLYGVDKLTSAPPNYYSQPNNNDKSSIDQRDSLPKQTLHYGPSVLPVSTPNHSHYQHSIPRSDQQYTNPSQHKVPSSTEQLPTYQSGHGSPHLTYSQVHKGSQPQTQVYAPVPSHALPSQHDYKLSTEPVPTVNLAPKQPPSQEVTCYICETPFSNMAELSEHMKIHAQGMVSQIKPPLTTQHQSFPTSTVGTLSSGIPVSNTHASAMKGSQMVQKPATPSFLPHSHVKTVETHPAKVKTSVPDKTKDVAFQKSKDNIKVSCSVCGKGFLKQAFLIEHMKVHTSPQQYECKVCGKVFKKKSKCARHEALHSRDIHLYYCEICDKNFEQKGKYLHHIQNQHTEQDSFRIHQHREHQTGTKKAVPLTGGSIDTTFDGVEVEKYIDCQICDEEIEKVKLVSHLKTHDVHTCDKCDQVFLQKTECVEHLMSQHRKELANTKSDDERDTPKKKSPVKVDGQKQEVAKVSETKSEVSGIIGKVNKSRKEVIKDLKEQRKEVRKNLKEKQKELRDLEKQKRVKEKKVKTEISSKNENVEDSEESKKSKNQNELGLSLNEVKLKFACSKCSMSFAKQSDLIVHVETHIKVRDPTRIYCEVCDYSYHTKEKGYYIYHMKYHRDHELINSKQPAQIPCHVCHTNIAKETFVTHVKRAHSQYSCDICQWSYSSENSLVKHMRSIHGGKKYKNYVYDESHYIEDIVEPAPSPEPPVVYKKLKDIKAEQQTTEKKKPSKVFACKECNRSYTTKQNYEKHLKTHNIVADEPQIVCELCQVNLDSRGTYIYHLQQHTGVENTAATDVKVVKAEDKVVKGFEGMNNKDESEQLNTELTKAKTKDENESQLESKDLKNNQSQSQKETSGILDSEKVEKTPVKQTWITVLNPETGDFEEKLIEDKDEPDIAIDIKIFEEDLNKVNDDEAEITDDKGDNKSVNEVVVGEIVYCRLCNKCVTRNTLSEHMRTHITYSCNSCQYAFMKKQRFFDHQHALHIKEFISEEIERFEQVENLLSEEPVNNESSAEQKEKELHRRKRSTKILNCPMCTSEFRQDKYIEHLKSHEKSVLICQFCERTFTKKKLLTIHEKSHEMVSHNRNELPFPKLCLMCDSSMHSRKSYMNHITEHSKKVVKCKKCEEMFTNEKILDNHVKINHDPHAKVYWKEDGEGLKFDTRTGRIHEVYSDYISEIKELNDLCKQLNKPAIWLTSTKKTKEKSMNVSKVTETRNKAESSESVETSESDEKIKSETSDEDYIPERSLRKRSGKVTESDDLEDDDNESEEFKPSKKKKRSSRYASDESVSDENYKPKSTRTRKVVVKKDLLKQKIKKLKQTAGRVLRSTIDNKTEKKSEKSNLKKTAIKRKPDTENKLSTCSPKRKRSEVDNLSFEEIQKSKRTTDFPERCPECGIAQFSSSSYKEHLRIHTGDMPFHCPVCEQSFTRACNMLTHVKHRHKEYSLKKLKKNMNKSHSKKPERTLRSREKSPDSKPGTPISSSTPIRGSRCVVKLSPLNIEEKKRSIASKSNSVKKSPESKMLESIEKKSAYRCDVCKKHFSQRWNYAQHIQVHKRDGKKKEKETKTVLSKKDSKKKEKESKPFSCKDCSESFKKKRDLYIHTKIHSTDEDDISDKTEVENLTTSLNTSVESVNSDKLDSTVDMTESFSDKNGKINDSRSEGNSSARNDSVEMSTDLNLGDSSEIDTESKGLVKKKKKSVKEQLTEGNGTKDESENSKESDTDKDSVMETNDDGMMVGKDKPGKTMPALNTKTVEVENSKDSDNNGCEAVKEISVPHNNNDDHSKSGDSDSEKTKLRSQPSVNKMSVETAVSKWKAKVTELLSSQLELHATKQQQELANPEIKRVKEYLSLSGKGEKHKFECRICGDSTCDEESTFRHHMDVHLNEPPPHCSICDIYFMAIHPKRRLAEHNKKKHPELNC